MTGELCGVCWSLEHTAQEGMNLRSGTGTRTLHLEGIKPISTGRLLLHTKGDGTARGELVVLAAGVVDLAENFLKSISY
jgi:hypothetical protein